MKLEDFKENKYEYIASCKRFIRQDGCNRKEDCDICPFNTWNQVYNRKEEEAKYSCLSPNDRKKNFEEYLGLFKESLVKNIDRMF